MDGIQLEEHRVKVNYGAGHLDDCPPGEVSPGEMAPGYLSLWLIVAPVNCRPMKCRCTEFMNNHRQRGSSAL